MTYTYKCKVCGEVFEAQQSIKDDPLKECPKCKGEIFRVISAAGIIYKCKGFYTTDSKG